MKGQSKINNPEKLATQTLENTKGEIKNKQSRETGNIDEDEEKQNKNTTIMCWSPLYASKHK
jgi:hypothetical protein